MDLSIGGYELPGQPDGYLSVWAITAPGKVSLSAVHNLYVPFTYHCGSMHATGHANNQT